MPTDPSAAKRDLRDPTELGLKLLEVRSGATNGPAPLSVVANRVPLHVRDYSSNLGPIEKYGRPQDIPSTMPCAIE